MNTPQKSASTLTQVIQSLYMTVKLLRSPKVPLWTKAIPIAAVAYLLFPLDFVPDLIPALGQLDDLTVLLIALWSFLQLCPPAAVSDVRGGSDVVDADYKVVKDDKPEPPPVGQIPPSNGPQH